MKKNLSVPALVLAALLAASIQPGIGHAREQDPPGSGPGKSSQLNAPAGSAPQVQGETGRVDAGGMHDERVGFGDEPDGRTRQDEFGVAPQTGEEFPGQFENRERERLESQPGERLEADEFGVAPEAEMAPPVQSDTREQERFDTAPEERPEQEQFGVAPQFEEESRERFENQQQDELGTGENGNRLEQEQFGVSPRFKEEAGNQGWVRPETERGGTGWRRKTRVPEGGR